MVKQITLSPTSVNIELENIVQTLKCINGHVIKSLKKVVASSERPINEEDCKKEWSDVATCPCDSSNGFLSKLHRFGEEVKKRLLFGDDDGVDQLKTGLYNNLLFEMVFQYHGLIFSYFLSCR